MNRKGSRARQQATPGFARCGHRAASVVGDQFAGRGGNFRRPPPRAPCRGREAAGGADWAEGKVRSPKGRGGFLPPVPGRTDRGDFHANSIAVIRRRGRDGASHHSDCGADGSRNARPGPVPGHASGKSQDADGAPDEPMGRPASPWKESQSGLQMHPSDAAQRPHRNVSGGWLHQRGRLRGASPEPGVCAQLAPSGEGANCAPRSVARRAARRIVHSLRPACRCCALRCAASRWAQTRAAGRSVRSRTTSRAGPCVSAANLSL